MDRDRPGQQCMILGRNANKIKKALVETEKISWLRKGCLLVASKTLSERGSPAKGAGSAAPLAAVSQQPRQFQQKLTKKSFHKKKVRGWNRPQVCG